MDYTKTALRLRDAGQEEEARKVLAEGVAYYLCKAEDLFNRDAVLRHPYFGYGGRADLRVLTQHGWLYNGQANVFDESLGEYVSKSIIVMTIAGGEEEQCLE